MPRKATRAPARKSRAVAPRARQPLTINATVATDSSVEELHGYRRAQTLTFPRLPFNVDRSPQLAMDDAGPFPFLPFLNSISQLGAFGLYFPGYPYLAQLAQRSEFRQPVETTAKEMTRKWIAFKTKGLGDKSKKIGKIEEAFEEFKLQALFRKVTELDGFYGMGQIFIEIDGQDNHAEPLLIDENTIEKGALKGFTTIEPMWSTPLVWNSTDPTAPNFYKPERWMVLGRETDQTRLINFISREVPDIIKPAYNFGGISLSQLIEPYVTRWLKTVDGVNRLINNFSIVNLGTDMAAVLEGGPDSELLKRARLFVKTRDNQGLFLTDKEAEQLQIFNATLSGLSELQAQAQEHMAAPTHLPLVVLTGITPAGLNASSDSEIEVFHDWINSMQESIYTDPLKKILKLVQLHLFGSVDEEIIFDYVPLKQLTGEALSRVKKTQGEMAVAYIDAGVVSAEEVRKQVATDPESGFSNLDPDKVPEPPEPEPMPGEEGGAPEPAARAA